MASTSAEKVLTILLAFTSNKNEMGTVELSEKLGFHKSTVSRLLHVLNSFGFVQQDPKSKKYILGRSAIDIGEAVNQSFSIQLVNIARPYLDGLRDRIGETVGFEVMSNGITTLVYEAKGPSPVHVSFNVGESLPVHAAAGAKVILAHSHPDVVDKYIKGRLTRLTPNTITEFKVFKEHLEEIRQQGVAFDRGEFDIHICAMAAPVFSHEKAAVASVVIAAPAYKEKSYLESGTISLLKETAAKISSRLNYSKD
ncbi:MAG: IclR family transcriptional regulator [Deltaproteobacteria bacterium]|nr:IclR family transcriptional regulator [Deltaproteobacteria bacterium]